MVISKNGMFFKEIPFNLENAKAIQNGTKRGFCVLDNGNYTHDVRIIATDIKDEECPIVVAVDHGKEVIVSVTECGTSAMNGSLRLYVPTRINTYENFIPSLYQSCLTRAKNIEHSSWCVNVCNGYQDDGETPTFFNKRKDYEWKCIPLCKTTLPIMGKVGISWKEYVERNIINYEDATM